MFRNFRFKIINIIFFIFVMFILLVAIISQIVFRGLINDYYIQLLRNDVESLLNNMKLYKNLIEESSKQITTNNAILEFLQKKNKYLNIEDILNGIKLSNTKILSVVMYDTNKSIFTSSYISDYPSLIELREDKALHSFFKDKDKKSIWLIRNNHIAKYYNNTYYRNELGVISYATKIYDKNLNLIGYLIIDIDPKYFYDYFIHNIEENDKNSVEIFVYMHQIGILPKEYNQEDKIKINHINFNDEKAENREGNIYLNSARGFLYTSYKLFDNGLIVIVYNTRIFNRDLLLYSMLIVIISLILLGTAYYLSKWLTDSIHKPLFKLVKKIRNYQTTR